MFDVNSRYYALETATHTTSDGREVSYKRRRFLPDAEKMTPLGEITVVPGDRLDIVAARVLGDAQQFWRIADANNAMNPTDLETPGDRLRIAT